MMLAEFTNSVLTGVALYGIAFLLCRLWKVWKEEVKAGGDA